MSGETARVLGQRSFLIQSSLVQLASTLNGGMLAPVTFFRDDPEISVSPYAVAPWAEEPNFEGREGMLAALRGDWFCSAFGENKFVHNGYHLPPHGESANCKWLYLSERCWVTGCFLKTGLSLQLQGGFCEATTSLFNDHALIYQCHDFSALTGPLNPGHHATLSFPDTPGAGHLSFSPFIHARTYFEPMERPENKGYSWLKPDVEITDLRSVPCIDSSMTDLTRYPARRGFEDIAIICADPNLEFAWSAATFPEQKYVWFALRDPKLLASTLLWFSNGGRHYPPWNGRHINVMGIEDITAFFHVGIAASCRPNLLTERGIKTCLEPDAQGRLSIPYIQGVARIPSEFDEVATIERGSDDSIVLTSRSGISVSTLCQLDFLKTGKLRGLELP